MLFWIQHNVPLRYAVHTYAYYVYAYTFSLYAIAFDAARALNHYLVATKCSSADSKSYVSCNLCGYGCDAVGIVTISDIPASIATTFVVVLDVLALPL